MTNGESALARGQKRLAGLLVGVLAVSSALAQDGFSTVSVDVSALPEKCRLVGKLLAARVAERGFETERGTPLAVRYVLSGASADESAAVRVSEGCAEISAARLRGLIFGTGSLLRSIVWTRNGFSVRNGEWRFAPAKSLRMAYLARHFLNWYMEATADELCRYADDLVLDGINSFNFQFNMPEVDAARATPDETRAFERRSRVLRERIAELDCDFCEAGGNNQLPEDAPENLRAERFTNRSNLGFNACPAKSGAMEALVANRQANLAKLKDVRVGFFCHWPYDEGGCSCAKCSPWGGNAFPKLIERFHGMNAKAHPEALTIVSTWCYDDADFEGFWRYLKSCDWIDYVLCDAHGEFPKYPLAHPIPGRAKMITFPEISMYGRFPWGGYGAIMMPKRYERLFRQVESVADGFMYYSEGLFEDVNKAVVLGLYLDPRTSADEILRRYSAYHFAGADPDDFVRLANLLEANHLGEDLRPARAAEAAAVAERMNGAMLESLRRAWRWRIVYLRALIDRDIAASPGFRNDWVGKDYDACVKPASVVPYIEELVRMYRAERQFEAVRYGRSHGWTCPQVGTSHDW